VNSAGPQYGRFDGRDDVLRAVEVLASELPEELTPLARLAYNYWWSWAPGGAALLESLDPLRWQRCGHNPVRLLQEIRAPRLAELASDAALVSRINALVARLTSHLEGFSPQEPLRPVVHMSAEFGIHASLPIYAGGLGVLMGDFLKEVSDQGMPAVGIGLLYWQGSFHQRLDPSGWQHEYWIETDAERLPATLVTDGRGEPLTFQVPARGHFVATQVWRVDVGRAPLFLLDTNRADNELMDRWITSRLYVGDKEMRLAQYAVLGIGGIKALRAMGIETASIHLNEGHAALAGIELVREGMASGLDRESAIAAAKARTTFTTHTPVPAGHDTFSKEEVLHCLPDMPAALQVDWEEFISMGRSRPENQSELFGTTPLALRLSRTTNAVSRLHGEVSRSMWHAMWPDSRLEDVPIEHITNGVHLPTWMAPEMQDLLDRYLPQGWRLRSDDAGVWAAIDDIPDEEIWAVRCLLRQRLVSYVRERSVWDRLGRGEPVGYAEAAARLWDDEVLTLGFVRRIATYKRLYLLTSNPDRGLRLLAEPNPLQLAIAGKAHPQDDEAKRTVQRVFALNRAGSVAGRTAFLEDLDLAMEPYLAHGCDVWLNTPRPPNEASGTSGMKSMLNGGLQLSVLDGWWAEAYDGSNGWSIMTPEGVSAEEQDARDAEAVFTLLESEVAPLFYDKAGPGRVPHAWVQKIKASMKTLAPRFNATRMVKEYSSR
jgi:glycogen phosphorylase